MSILGMLPTRAPQIANSYRCLSRDEENEVLPISVSHFLTWKLMYGTKALTSQRTVHEAIRVFLALIFPGTQVCRAGEVGIGKQAGYQIVAFSDFSQTFCSSLRKMCM